MINALLSEYESMIGKKKIELIYALICYYRFPKFRVRVLTRWLVTTNSAFLKEIISNKLMVKYGMDVAKSSQIRKNLKIEHYNGIVFGIGTIIGDNCTIYQQVTIGQKNGEYPVIGNNVVIYPGAKVLGGITVGDNAVIAANAVVLHNVGNGEVVAGIPAKKIR